ncbi:MAG: LysM peptidoglycan-binding domain-containing protein, partial [Bacteroidota bacterium]
YEESVAYMGTHVIQNRNCHKIALKDHQYHIKNYRVKLGENLIDIAQRLLIHPFKIRELNPEIDSYYELEAGQNIRIPSSYGKTCIIYLDDKEYLPRRLEVYDENGMFEQYSFHDIHVKR